MKIKPISSDLMNNLSEAGGKERRLSGYPGGMILCEVGSASNLELRRVNPDSDPVQVVGGHRELARDRNNLNVNYRWLIKDPRGSQKCFSILVSKKQTSLSKGIFEEMLSVQPLRNL